MHQEDKITERGPEGKIRAEGGSPRHTRRLFGLEKMWLCMRGGPLRHTHRILPVHTHAKRNRFRAPPSPRRAQKETAYAQPLARASKPAGLDWLLQSFYYIRLSITQSRVHRQAVSRRRHHSEDVSMYGGRHDRQSIAVASAGNGVLGQVHVLLGGLLGGIFRD